MQETKIITVVLENELSKEEVQKLMSAINQLRGVRRVERPVPASEEVDTVAVARARSEIRKKLFEALESE